MWSSSKLQLFLNTLLLQWVFLHHLDRLFSERHSREIKPECSKLASRLCRYLTSLMLRKKATISRQLPTATSSAESTHESQGWKFCLCPNWGRKPTAVIKHEVPRTVDHSALQLVFMSYRNEWSFLSCEQYCRKESVFGECPVMPSHQWVVLQP